MIASLEGFPPSFSITTSQCSKSQTSRATRELDHLGCGSLKDDDVWCTAKNQNVARHGALAENSGDLGKMTKVEEGENGSGGRERLRRFRDRKRCDRVNED
ncbi:hypothetical protein ACH5RR_037590 [Cinchona calisaya]|uniref:Uncharacterized protein n=1 Tax=Cinchona calisaya TaxID=153742 RepID=A0ABD2Y8X1_9GENT